MGNLRGGSVDPITCVEENRAMHIAREISKVALVLIQLPD